MKKTDQIVKYIIVILCLFTFVWSLKFIWQKEKWSPIDEYAHMDYIEKMSEGRMPKLQDAVSNDIYMDLIEHPEHSFTPPIHNREELGMGNYSYQAKHPPIYYAFLLGPNMLMQKAEYKAFERLKVLRIISYLLFVLGSLICIPIFNLINQKGIQTPQFYSWACVLFSLLIATHQRYGLTNNMLSPLFINASLYFVLKYHVTYQIKFLYRFIFVAGLSLSVALTNLFIIPFLFLYALIIYIPHFTKKTFIYACSLLLISLSVILWWKLTTIPDKAFEEYLQNLLLAVIPANAITFKMFLDLLLNDTFQLSFISEQLDITKIYLICLSINILVSVLFFKSILKQNKWVLVSKVVFLVFVINLYFLNRYVDRVHWVAFRNYLGFIPVVFISCSSFIVVLFRKYLAEK